MIHERRGLAAVAGEAARAALVVGGLFVLLDLWQVALLNPGSLRGRGVAWLLGLYFASTLGAALVALAAVWIVRRALPMGAPAWVRAGLFCGGGFLLAQETALRALSPLSPWRPWAVAGAALVALALVLPARRVLRRVPVWAAALGLATLLVAMVGASRGFGPQGERAAHPAPDARANAGKRPNVVLVLIDTLRADHLGCYGYQRPTSPRIDAFAAEGVRFERNFSQSSWTKPATASVLTSHYPSMHQTYLEQQKLPESEVLLAQLMKQQGYATATFSGNPWVTPDYGFDRGVDHFYSIYDERFARVTLFMNVLKRVSKLAGGPSARVYNRVKMLVQGELSTTARDEAINREAFAWLAANKDQPFFLYMHYMSPHHPYDPPPPFDRFVPDKTVKPVTYYPKKSYYFFEEGEQLPEAQRQDMIARYDGDILFADTVFGGLVDELRRQGVLDDTLVILLSDHGEEFYDHRNWGHGQSIYNELISVPLLMRLPGTIAPGTRVADPVMNVDVLPTILEVVGAPVHPTAAGRSVLALARGDAAPRAPEAYSELIYKYGAARGVVDDERKLIEMTKGEETRKELYDMTSDFHEQQNLMASEPGRAETLDRQLAEVRDWAERRQAAASAATIDDEQAKRLKALGYLN